MTEKTIAITGTGLICAAGNNRQETWETLAKGEVRNHIPEPAFFAPHPPSPLFSVRAEDVPGCCDTDFFPGLRGDKTPPINRTTALLMRATEEACRQASLSPTLLQKRRVGVVVGTTVGCTFHNESYYLNWKQGIAQDISPVTTYLSSNLAETLQQLLMVNGPRAVITSACASGTDAIGLGNNWLKNGLCDLVIAGGSDEISRIACHGFSSLMLFSQSNCRPFDRKRTGLNLGEGAAVLVLERKEKATARGVRPQGYLLGYGTASDAFHPTAPHPEGRGLQRAITDALQQAEVSLARIAYINAHGTGTKANDLAETTALFQLGLDSSATPVISTKGATGHTLGAAGAIEAILTLQTLREGKTGGTIGCREMDDALPLPVLAEGCRKKISGTIGLSQSLAFGGSNSALVLEASS